MKLLSGEKAGNGQMKIKEAPVMIEPYNVTL